MSDVLKAVEALAPAFAGRLILPSHADYHDASHDVLKHNSAHPYRCAITDDNTVNH